MSVEKTRNTIIMVSPTSEDMRGVISRNDVGRFFPPLGTLLVAQALDNAGYNVIFFDGNFDKDYNEKLIAAAETHRDSLLFVGIYISILQISDSVKIAQAIKEKFGVPIVTGGPMASSFTQIVAKSELVDFCIATDGVQAATKLADALRDGTSFEKVPNLHYKIDGIVRTSGIRARDVLTNDLVIEYEKFIDIENYISKFNVYLPNSGPHTPTRAVPLLTGLGCSYKCAFCENALLNAKHVSLSAEEIIDQVKLYKEKYRIDAISFFDEDFAYDRERMEKLVNLLIEEDIGIVWGTQSRANYFTERYINGDFIERMEQSGCRRIAIGVESGSPKILKSMRKGISRKMILGAANIAKKSKIVFSYSIMVNLPNESLDDLKMTDDIIRLLMKTKKNSHISGVHEYIAYPGTPWSAQAEKALTYDFWEKFTLSDFVDLDLTEYNKTMLQIEGDKTWQRRCLVFYMKFLSLPAPKPTSIIQSFLLIIYRIGQLRRSTRFYRIPLELISMEIFRRFRGRNPIV